ncbi:hypothetical protein [Desulfosporosinus shakirovi]|uniref:hypothetical protein n=1 Tax=Desulfosporosinus shakirovi TaxID=2885154 RepID=UPI001E5ABAEE|nr:hypothetical protein [Desulfosporosinus sp. SRJS8]MCB8814689.1 hypothetical protein [Desulfosporosinus sp. SRJS8]
MDHSKEQLRNSEFSLEFYVSGTKIEDNPEVNLNWDYSTNHSPNFTVKLQVDVHNPSKHIYKGEFSIGIVTPSDLSVNHSKARVVITSEGKNIHLLPDVRRMFPNGWESLTLFLEPKGEFGQKKFRFSINHSCIY